MSEILPISDWSMDARHERWDHFEEIVKEAFKQVERPPDSELTNGQTWHLEDIAVAARLKSRTWQSLRPEEVWSFPFSILTPKAYRYFLPAGMLAQCPNPYGPGVGPSGLCLDFSKCKFIHDMIDYTESELSAMKIYVEMFYYAGDKFAEELWTSYWSTRDPSV